MSVSSLFRRIIHTQLFRGALVLLVMSFIVLMTSQPAVTSTISSHAVGGVIAQILLALPFSDEFLPALCLPLDQQAMIPAIDHYVRKTAHFVEYSALGFVLVAFMRYTKCIGSKAYWLTPIIGCLFAAMDELHQSFVPGRSCQLSDVMLDTSGVIFGLLVYCVMKGLVRKCLKHSRFAKISVKPTADGLSQISTI